MEKYTNFVEYTVLTVLLWIGLWGSISLVLDHWIHSFGMKALTYLSLVIVSFHFLRIRNHI